MILAHFLVHFLTHFLISHVLKSPFLALLIPSIQLAELWFPLGAVNSVIPAS
jgi:hypothetical protein